MPYPFADMVLYFFLYSFCVWLMETALCSVRERRFINRGFLNGPLCPIYGCGILLILTFLLPVRDGIPQLTTALPVIFLAGAALASAVEYFTSWAMEKLFHARWWDYSDHRFNVGGRICLSISAAWGALATGFVYLIQPQFERLVGRLYGLYASLPLILAVILLTVFLADTVLSVRIASVLGNKLEQLDRLGDLIREHAGLLDRLNRAEISSPEDIALRLESAYDRYESRRRSRREKRAENSLFFSEDPGVWLSARIHLLKAKKTGLQQIGFLHRRMLKAFPTLRSHPAVKGIENAAAELRELLRKK